MRFSLAHSRGRFAPIAMVLIGFGLTTTHAAARAEDPPSGIAASKADLLALTPLWDGERYPDGRPKVPEDLLRRMKAISMEEAWEVLRKHGYNNQFEGDWMILHPDQPFAGRALTAQYLPSRPDLDDRVLKIGEQEGRIGPSNSWPIDMLEQGDVYVADGFGKIADGTLIGDNLGNAIYARSGNGVVFNASVRDVEGLLEIEGFNALIRGLHPSFMSNMIMASINRPIRIGGATVLPGDVILANRTGVIAIPAHLAEEVVVTGEIVAIKDEFGHLRLREGKYTPGQIDVPWTDEIKADFFDWLEDHPNKPPIPNEEIEPHL